MITTEICPNCKNPNMRIEHGVFDHLNRQIHLEYCPDCGEHTPIVGYNCLQCKLANNPNIRGFATSL